MKKAVAWVVLLLFTGFVVYEAWPAVLVAVAGAALVAWAIDTVIGDRK